MSPLIALALRLFPTILDSIVGDRSKKVTEAIEKVVSSAAGFVRSTSSGAEAQN